MKTMIGLTFGLGCLIGVIAFTPQGHSLVSAASVPFDGAAQMGLGGFDKRPVRSILIIGNSRTYYHDMPAMVSRMADSAHSPVRFSITLQAWGGADFQDNWNNAEVQRLLGQHWDQVILQPASRAQTSDSESESSATYGEKMISAAHATRSPVAMIVNWGYGEQLYAGDPPQMRQQYIDTIESSTRTLASHAGAELIDTSHVWEQVHGQDPDLSLYEDGNHPTVYGSYLSALMIYGFLDHDDIAAVAYRPNGADDRAIRTVRDAVVTYYGGKV